MALEGTRGYGAGGYARGTQLGPGPVWGRGRYARAVYACGGRRGLAHGGAACNQGPFALKVGFDVGFDRRYRRFVIAEILSMRNGHIEDV